MEGRRPGPAAIWAHRNGWRLMFALLALSTGIGATCEQQDFIEVPEVLEVSASQGVVSVPLEAPIKHDVVTRHALDYRIENPSADTVELVVEAQSLVNGVLRASGRAVHRLSAGGAVQGRISDLELELGNELDVALQCCQASTCPTGEVICPEARDGVTAPPEVCLNGCRDQASCVQACGPEATCADTCQGDLVCEDGCPRDASCLAACDSAAVACAASCLALYGRCVDEYAIDSTVTVPCGLCEGEAGLCLGISATNRGIVLRDAENATKQCSPACTEYPGVCMTGCEALHAPEMQLICLARCVGLFQTYCGRDPTAVDPDVRVPCCYSEACEGRLEAVAKLAAVECFEDSQCASQRRCNAQGRCENRVRETQTGCSIGPLRGAPRGSAGWSTLAALVLACFGPGRRRQWARRSLGLATMLVLAGVAWPGESQAEPRGFRRTRSSFTAGLSTGTFVAGPVGDATQLGVGLVVQETIQSGYWGGSVRLGASVYPTSQGELPFDHGIQTYTLALGPRFTFPTFDNLDLLVFVQPEYEYTGIQSNVLVRSTDGDTLHALAAWSGLVLLTGSLVVELDVGAAWLPQADAVKLTGALSVGMVGNL